MNLNLNTQQIVLLCLLIAFVVSISTGITVVSLMDQSEAPVTQTINRVVERTIEKVVEPENNDNNTTITETPERIIETVVVNQEDLTVEAVQKNSRSLIRVHVGENEPGEFVTLGVAVTNNSILVDKNMISKNSDYVVKTQMGNFSVDILSYDQSENFVILQLSDGQTGLQPANFGDSNSIQLAQSVISISGSDKNSISTGVINKLDTVERVDGDNTWNEVTNIYAGVDANNVLVGSIITNLQGDIIGFKAFNQNQAKTTFTPSNFVKSFLSARGI